jgi:hypothetical protein
MELIKRIEMKRYMITIALIGHPYIIANTCLDTNKSIKFKDGDCDEVENRIKIPTKKGQTYLAFKVVEKASSSRSGSENILVDMQGNEITTIKIDNQTEIAISINLSEHKTPIMLKYGDIQKRIAQEEGEITLKVPVNKLGSSDKIIIQSRSGRAIIEIRTSK